MQLTRDNKIMPLTKDFDVKTDSKLSSYELKEKKSSKALVMNPVASGDNVTVNYNSTHRLKEEIPPLVPCCEGKELQINPEVVHTGLSAISLKHNGVYHSLSLLNESEKSQTRPGLIKHRNSFRCLQRPDLKRVPYFRRMSPDELETLFRGYADEPSRGNLTFENNNTSLIMMPKDEFTPSHDYKGNEIENRANENCPLHAVLDRKPDVEDVPDGMRLHVARARLYTSVLASSKTGDHLDANSTCEEYDSKIADDPLPEDEVMMREELQIILPPRCDDQQENISMNPSNQIYI